MQETRRGDQNKKKLLFDQRDFSGHFGHCDVFPDPYCLIQTYIKRCCDF
jgi:hypothetical protein